MFATDRYGPIKLRLRQVRALLLDEISLVPAANLSVMYELRAIVQSNTRPCLWLPSVTSSNSAQSRVR